MYNEFNKVIEFENQVSHDQFVYIIKETFNIDEKQKINIQQFEKEWGEFVDLREVPIENCKLYAKKF